jgi:hypothetical protein
MIFRRSAVAFLAALLAGASVRAAPPASPPPASTNLTLAPARPLDKFGWGGIGIYGGSGATFFGVNGGVSVNVMPLAPDLPLSVFGNAGLAFSSDFTIIPLTAGAAVHYDKLPAQLFGGAGLTVVPHTGGGDTPIGLGILLMGLYPLPQMGPNLSAQAQFQLHILSDSFTMWVLTVGLGYSF